MHAIRLTSKSDLIGASTSALCLIHCLATPILFVAQAGLSNHGESHPQWWGFLDILFLVISYFAVWWSGTTTSRAWIRRALWTSWIVLCAMVLNEKLAVFPLIEEVIYIPTTGLIFLHLYKRRYCHCGEEECCVENG